MKTSGYIRIYDYLAHIIARCDGTNLRLPSENELCQIFGVTRPTVRYALKDLIEEELVTVVRGKGTYINWEKACKTSQLFKCPEIGVICGESKSEDTYIPIRLVNMLRKHGYYYDMLNMSTINDIQSFVKQKSYKAVIWNYPADTVFRKDLEKLEIPVLALNHRLPFPWDIDQIVDHLKLDKTAYTLAKHVHERGHKTILYLPVGNLSLSGEKSSWISFFCKKMNKYLGSNLKTEDVVLPFNKLDGKLKQVLSGDKSTTLIYCEDILIPHVIDKINKSGLKIPEDISLISWNKPDNQYLSGKSITYLDREESLNEKLYEWLKLRLSDRNTTGEFLSETSVRIHHGDSVETLQN